MPTLINIPKDRRLRPLINDLLPYEVPLRLTYFFLFDALKKGDNADALVNILRHLASPTVMKEAIPYSYSIQKNENERRTLSVIHPALLEDFCNFLETYGRSIINSCSKSAFSLRCPVGIATAIYSTNDTKTSPITIPSIQGVPSELLHSNVEFLGSYFSYRSYTRLHQFFSSREIDVLESRFLRIRFLDVARCFESIYTHTFSWAVRGKGSAKQSVHLEESFDHKFDRLMQRANHNETKGILVGPEVSRVFAEVIMQDIDRAVEREMQHDIRANRVKIKRYIDDYYVFFNDDTCADKVQRCLERELLKHKLTLNHEKTKELRRPFANQRGAMMESVRESMRRFTDQLCEKEGADGNERKLRDNWILRVVQSAISLHGGKYDDVVGFLLSALIRSVERVKPNDADTYLECFLDSKVMRFAFHLFLVSPRYFPGMLLAQLTLVGRSLAERGKSALKLQLESEIESCVHDMLITIGSGDRDCRSEMTNILIACADMDFGTPVSSENLVKIWPVLGSDTRSDNGEIDYFQTLGLLWFMRKRPHYQKLRFQLEQRIVRKVNKCEHIISDTELLMMSLDCLCCPFLSPSIKGKLAGRLASALKLVGFKVGEKCFSKQDLLNMTAQRNAFFDWNDNRDALFYLQKKRQVSSY